MSMGFKPESVLDCKTPLEVEKFLEAKLQPISILRIACTSEVEGIIALIEKVFPLPIAHISKVGMMHLLFQSCLNNTISIKKDCQR